MASQCNMFSELVCVMDFRFSPLFRQVQNMIWGKKPHHFIKRLSTGDSVAEQQQMLLALLQPIESRLSFPHTEYASLAEFILFKALFGRTLVECKYAEIIILLQICSELILQC